MPILQLEDIPENIVIPITITGESLDYYFTITSNNKLLLLKRSECVDYPTNPKSLIICKSKDIIYIQKHKNKFLWVRDGLFTDCRVA